MITGDVVYKGQKRYKPLIINGNVFNNIVDMQVTNCVQHAEADLFGTLNKSENKYEWKTYAEFGVQVENFKKVLRHYNIEKGDSVALISNNREEWAVIYYACMHIGARIVPMYEAQSESDWRYIVENSEAKMVVSATDSIFEKTKGYANTVGQVHSTLCIESDAQYMHSYSRWMSMVESEPEIPRVQLQPTDVATIIYTSGTTGNPKGVLLSHHNLISNLYGTKDMWQHELNKENVSLAFLPWAHVFGQTAELHSCMAAGSSMGIVNDRDTLLSSLQLVKPSVLISVPALFNRIYDGIHAKVSKESPLKQKIFHAALTCKRKVNHKLEFGETPGPLDSFLAGLADKVVFSKLRAALGGNLRWAASGGAACSVVVAQFFEDIGIPVCEGYGLTETSPVITSCSNSWANRRLGCSGIAITDVKLRIIDPETLEERALGAEGEVTCTGPCVMLGYFKNDEANKEVFYYHDGERYFRTGDLGRIVDGRFLKITGRHKEQFKLENGKYVVPAPLEDALCRSKFIAQTLLYGLNKPHTIALLVPDMLELGPWAEERGIALEPVEALCQHPQVVDLLTNELRQAAAAGLKNYERPLRWGFITEPFTQENGLLTPKMSIRRNQVISVYSDLVEDIFSGQRGYDA